MAKTLSDIDNHKNAAGKKLFGGGVAAMGKIGSTLSQLRDVLPFILMGAIVLLAILLG